MSEIKYDENIKKLLKAHNLPANVIEIVENDYINSINGVKEEVTTQIKEDKEKEAQPQNVKKEFHNDVRDIANETRIIK